MVAIHVNSKVSKQKRFIPPLHIFTSVCSLTLQEHFVKGHVVMAEFVMLLVRMFASPQTSTKSIQKLHLQWNKIESITPVVEDFGRKGVLVVGVCASNRVICHCTMGLLDDRWHVRWPRSMNILLLMRLLHIPCAVLAAHAALGLHVLFHTIDLGVKTSTCAGVTHSCFKAVEKFGEVQSG